MIYDRLDWKTSMNCVLLLQDIDSSWYRSVSIQSRGAKVAPEAIRYRARFNFSSMPRMCGPSGKSGREGDWTRTRWMSARPDPRSF